MESDTFVRWLQEELDKREMTSADLARKAGLTQSQISRVMSYQRGAGMVFYRGVAKAFGLPEVGAEMVITFKVPSSV